MRALGYVLGGGLALLFGFWTVKSVVRRRREFYYVDDSTLARLRKEGF